VLAGNVAAAALLVYCVVPQPALSPRSGGQDSARALPLAASAAPSASAVSHAGIDEEHYTPFIARPAFSAATEALEQGDHAKALAEITRAVKAAPPEAADRARLALFTGLVAERAGEAEQALAAFEQADQPSYVLFGHARIGRARALAALGRAAEALTLAKSAPDEPALLAEKRRVIADAARARGDLATTRDALRAGVEGAKAPERWSLSLALAEVLLDAKPGPVTSEQAIEALSLSRRVGAEAAARSELASKAQELEATALAALPAAA
jgi:hypothetical protein